MKARKFLSELTSILPISWSMLGIEYGACWWENQSSLFELLMSVLGAFVLSYVLIILGNSIAYEKTFEKPIPPNLRNIIIRLLITIIALFVISVVIAG